MATAHQPKYVTVDAIHSILSDSVRTNHCIKFENNTECDN